MYGLIHQALRRFVLSLPDGEEMLVAALEHAGIDGKFDDFFRYYTDEETMNLVSMCAEVIGMNLDELMYNAGLKAVYTFIENGYVPVLRTLGDDFFTLIQNLDSFHDNFLAAFPQMKSPSFQPIRNPDDTMTIEYYSTRTGLAQFTMGALKATAEVLFELDITIQHRVKRGSNSDKDVFHLFVDEKAFPVVDNTITEGLGAEMSTLALNKSLTCTLLPWHFQMSRDFKILSLGQHLAARMKKDILGKDVRKVFKIVTPMMAKYDFDLLRSFLDKPFIFTTQSQYMMTADEYNKRVGEAILKHERLQQKGGPGSKGNDIQLDIDALADDASVSSKAQSERESMASSLAASSKGSFTNVMANRMRRMNDVESLNLHGQVAFDAESDTLIFVGNPPIKSQEEIERHSLSLQQLPIHSHGREMLYSAMYQALSSENATKVQDQLAELDSAMDEVNQKKTQIDGLLHSILPQSVATSLAEGRIPDPEAYQDTSILFCNIDRFTNISSEVPTEEIMEMLHELFLKFDALADEHGCYKVETIGDQYMVCAGCPDRCDDHAERIASLAIAMVKAAESIISPLDGEPLKIAVGLHSGPLMAGVVGRARPRYCLFGDTVTVASLMETNGIPGCIQTTYRFRRNLAKSSKFIFGTRGFLNMGDKGKMKTFLVIGSSDAPESLLLPSKEEYPELVSELIMSTMRPGGLQSQAGETVVRSMSPKENASFFKSFQASRV